MNYSFKRPFFALGIGLFLLVWLIASVVPVLNHAKETAVVHAAPLAQTTFQIHFSSLSYSPLESAGTSQITVQISPAITDTTVITVEYLTEDGFGTATEGAGNDYLSASGTLTFTNASSNATFNITILEDTVDEPDETVFLSLRNQSANAILVNPSAATLTIVDNDPTPSTATPTATPGGVIYVDAYEPNNALQESYTTSSGTKICSITLWPQGDLDYFRFVGKAGSYYDVLTSDLDPGVDTALKVFDTQGNLIDSNDDFEVGNRRSQVTIAANANGFYYARIENRDPSDPANKTYCFEVREITPPTPEPSATPIPGDSDCEFNSTIETACTIGLDQTYSFDFVPVFGSLQDTDVFRIWMKPGIEYTCETTIPTGSFADTNMIFLDNNGNDFQPNLGNDDKAFGDLGSKLSYLSAYTGWLHVMVGPVNVPPYEEAQGHKYDLSCTATIATATPTATSTRAFTGGGSPPVATSTPIVFPTFPPTPTPIDLSGLNLGTPIPPTPPVVQFQPLPTATPLGSDTGIELTINVTLYYDENGNFMPELTEGVVDTAVTLYDNSSGELIAFGYTNEAGLIRFDSITARGPVRVVVPFLNYTQIVTGESANILVRVAPQPLPAGIP